VLLAALAEPSVPGAVVIVVAVALGTATQRLTGLGFSLVSAPVLVAVLGPHDGVRLANELALLAQLSTLGLLWSDVRWRDGSRVLVPALLVTPVAALVVRNTDQSALSVVAGVLTLLVAAAMASRVRVRSLSGRGGAVAAGVTSATMNVMSGLSGPPVAMYALNAGWPPHAFRATLTAYFAALNLAAIAALGVVMPSPGLAVGLAAALVGGLVAGHQLVGRVDGERLRGAVLVVAITGGLVAIGKGLS
jgi:uncharacterized membrane protein YfcA